MAIAKADAGNYMDYPCFGPGQFNYHPSNNLLEGYWYLLPVTLYSQTTTGTGQNQTTTYTAVATSQCMVLVVDNYFPGGGKTSSTFTGGMMGISAKSENINYNVLLNASTMSGTPLPPAYVLTPPTTVNSKSAPATCTIGQTQATNDGFKYINLQPVAAPPLPVTINQTISSASTQNGQSSTQSSLVPNPVNTAWAMPPVIATFSQGVSPNITTVFLAATLEIDTGITSMLVAAPAETFPLSFSGTPDSTTKQSTFVDGIVTAIFTPETTMNKSSNPEIFSTGLLNYGFITGSGNGAPAPDKVILMPPVANTLGDMTRVNTGIMPLSKNMYMYDALNGVIGISPVRSS